jgi:hypothetical protein
MEEARGGVRMLIGSLRLIAGLLAQSGHPPISPFR